MREALKSVTPPVHIHSVWNGDDALRFLRQEADYSNAPRPALVFLDFHVPKMESREILRFIKGNDSLKQIAVAVLTTLNTEEAIHEAYALGANCYLFKPSDLAEFLDTISGATRFWLSLAARPA